MKKAIIIFCALILVIVVVFFCLYFVLTTPKLTGDFSISDYQNEIYNINFQTDKNYGTINDYKSAARAGKTAIAERFKDCSGSIFDWIGCDVQYDEENDAYYIRTYPVSPLVLGGGHNVIVGSDGAILAIWGVK